MLVILLKILDILRTLQLKVKYVITEAVTTLLKYYQYQISDISCIFHGRYLHKSEALDGAICATSRFVWMGAPATFLLAALACSCRLPVEVFGRERRSAKAEIEAKTIYTHGSLKNACHLN